MSHTRRIRFHRQLKDVRLREPVAGNLANMSQVEEGLTHPVDAALPTHAQIDIRALEELLHTVSEQLTELENRRQQSLGELQQAAVELALVATEHMLKREIAQDQYPIAEMVATVIQKLESAQTIRIRLHPQDLQLLQKFHAEHGKAVDWGTRVTVEADAGLERGSCLADGGDYGLQTSISQQIEGIRQCFMEGIEDAQVERRSTPDEAQDMRRFPDRRETA